MSLRCIDDFLATVDPSKTTVVSFTDYLLVFGGSISNDPKLSGKTSQRDAFISWTKANRPDLMDKIIFPESYEDWKDFNTYPDLLEFEKDLGYLTSVVVVFLEGAGSIAELGAFSQIKSLWSRILVIISSDRSSRRSFITLGPIRSIRTTHQQHNAVCVISDETPDSVTEDIEVIVQNIEERGARKSAQERLSSANEQHQIFLVLDSISLFQFLQISEIQQIARPFFPNLTIDRLKQILFLLTKVGLIRESEYGNSTYYGTPKVLDSYIDYTAKTGLLSFDRLNMRARALNETNASNIRRKAYAAYLRVREAT